MSSIIASTDTTNIVLTSTTDTTDTANSTNIMLYTMLSNDDVEEYKEFIKHNKVNYYHIFGMVCETGAFRIMEYITYVQKPCEIDGFNALKYESKGYLEKALDSERFDVFEWLVKNRYYPWDLRDKWIPLWLKKVDIEDRFSSSFAKKHNFLQSFL